MALNVLFHGPMIYALAEDHLEVLIPDVAGDHEYLAFWFDGNTFQKQPHPLAREVDLRNMLTGSSTPPPFDFLPEVNGLVLDAKIIPKVKILLPFPDQAYPLVVVLHNKPEEAVIVGGDGKQLRLPNPLWLPEMVLLRYENTSDLYGSPIPGNLHFFGENGVVPMPNEVQGHLQHLSEVVNYLVPSLQVDFTPQANHDPDNVVPGTDDVLQFIHRDELMALPTLLHPQDLRSACVYPRACGAPMKIGI